MKKSKKEKKKAGEITYKKIGGGSFFLNKNKIIKPGQTFNARPEEIPEGFKDVVVPVDSVEAAVVKKKSKASKKKSKYTLDSKGGGWYHVFDAEGKQVTEKKVRKKEAEELIETLG